MERLTKCKTTKGVTKAFIKPCLKTNEAIQLIINKLCAFEDVLEKYNIDSVEELDETLEDSYYTKKAAIMVRKHNQKFAEECAIWEKACELACAEIPGVDDFLAKQNDFYDRAYKILEDELCIKKH